MCDTLCAIGPARTLFAKNSDRPRDEVQVVESHAPREAGGSLRATHIEIEDAGAFAVLGSRPAWMWGFEHGINEHRVAIGNETVFTVDDPSTTPPALTGMDLVRLGLERARSADEALDVMTALLERYGQGGPCKEHGDPYWSSFLVADPHRAWVLETSGRAWAARLTDDGAAISNRVTLGTDWTRASSSVPAGTDFDEWRDPQIPTKPADDRLRATRACLATGAAALGPADLVATLRHHGERPWGAPGSDPRDVSVPPSEIAPDLSGFSVCFHVNEPEFEFVEATASSMVAELPADPDTPMRAWLALASPCASVYLPVFPTISVPAAFAEAATWHRFAALRDRVESGREALVAVRGVLGPLESRLWEEADGASTDPTAHAAFVASAWHALDEALTRLGV